mgnify:CR=1 FL=1
MSGDAGQPDEIRRRLDVLGDLPSLLETVSRSVADLIGSTGCGIGLLNAERTAVVHVAAHGFRTPEWSRLSMPVGEGIIGRAALSGAALRVDDVRTDPRSAQRDVDEKEALARCERVDA